MKNKKILIPVILILVVALLAFLKWDTIERSLYLSKNNISSEMKKDPASYVSVAKDGSDYLVYFFDLETCEKCGDYTEELKTYEKNNDSFPIYKVDLSKLKAEVLSDVLFVDPSQPYIFHIKSGDVFYSYVGGFSADKLPNKIQQADPL